MATVTISGTIKVAYTGAGDTSISAPGLKVGDVVVAVYNPPSTLVETAGLFESLVSVNDELQSNGNTITGTPYVIVLVRAS